MSYIMDTLFGDGTPSQDASDPLATLGRFANTAIAFGAGVAVLGGSIEVLSNGVDGGMDMGGGGAPATDMSANVTFSNPSA